MVGSFFLNVGGFLAIIGAIATGYVAVRKLGPERDRLFITSAQGAAVIQDNLVKTLEREVDRERARSTALAARLELLQREVVHLRAANDALVRRHGDRHDDNG